MESQKTKLNLLGKAVVIATFLVTAVATFFVSVLIIGGAVCLVPGSGCDNWGGLGAGMVALLAGMIVGPLVGILITSYLAHKYFINIKSFTVVNRATVWYAVTVLLVFVVIPLTFFYRNSYTLPTLLENQYVSQYHWSENYGLSYDFHNVLSQFNIPEIEKPKRGYILQSLASDRDLNIGDVVVNWCGGSWLGNCTPEDPQLIIGLPGDTMKWINGKRKIIVTRGNQVVWEINVVDVKGFENQSFGPMVANTDGVGEFLQVPLEDLVVDGGKNYIWQPSKPYYFSQSSSQNKRDAFKGIVVGYSFGQ